MHELALSEDIVREAVHACGERASKMTALAVQVGALSSASPSALEFCLRAVLDEHGLTQTRACVACVPALVRCVCGHRYQAEDMFAPCPRCGQYTRDILQGRDVVIQYVEVEDGED
ncbi:MAG: hydrogenase maturation nickel metallochaperone HypA [Candidatus Brocadiaceae bacterium]|nr:hydrogenase maturation nickel metallochaperone HypA [Candidatus Brocadiaceae bacterium]